MHPPAFTIRPLIKLAARSLAKEPGVVAVWLAGPWARGAAYPGFTSPELAILTEDAHTQPAVSQAYQKWLDRFPFLAPKPFLATQAEWQDFTGATGLRFWSATGGEHRVRAVWEAPHWEALAGSPPPAPYLAPAKLVRTRQEVQRRAFCFFEWSRSLPLRLSCGEQEASLAALEAFELATAWEISRPGDLVTLERHLFPPQDCHRLFSALLPALWMGVGEKAANVLEALPILEESLSDLLPRTSRRQSEGDSEITGGMPALPTASNLLPQTLSQGARGPDAPNPRPSLSPSTRQHPFENDSFRKAWLRRLMEVVRQEEVWRLAEEVWLQGIPAADHGFELWVQVPEDAAPEQWVALGSRVGEVCRAASHDLIWCRPRMVTQGTLPLALALHGWVPSEVPVEYLRGSGAALSLPVPARAGLTEATVLDRLAELHLQLRCGKVAEGPEETLGWLASFWEALGRTLALWTPVEGRPYFPPNFRSAKAVFGQFTENLPGGREKAALLHSITIQSAAAIQGRGTLIYGRMQQEMQALVELLFAEGFGGEEKNLTQRRKGTKESNTENS